MGKIIFVYDTQFGNTRELAEHMCSELEKNHTTSLFHIEEIPPEELSSPDLIVIGTPTHGGRPTPPVDKLLQQVQKDIPVAVFDTSTSPVGESRFLKFIIRFFGYASTRMEKSLKNRGITVPGASTFLVTGREGPIIEGEKERAVTWVKSLL